MVDDHSVTLPEDPKEAQRVFNSLSVKNQLDLVLQARGKDRLHYIFLSEHPEPLVQQLPELEVFLTVKEAGEKDCLDLISLTTPEQFQFLLDLDFWKRDQLDPEKILHWMEILLESGALGRDGQDPSFYVGSISLRSFQRQEDPRGFRALFAHSLPGGQEHL
ncbi:MAG: hypothetical protein H6Q41_2939 [Deltaproteobacteria bacterium]|nr:hypothetical protein [Deltaproteobacteria bacterium]